jgi:hypothetical protein
MLQFLIFDFEFWIGGGDWLMRSQGKDAGRRRGERNKGGHDLGIYSFDLHCQH